MRFSLRKLLTSIFVVALVLASIVNQRRAHLEIFEHNARAEARERLEDDFERALIERLAPGTDLNGEPYYRLLVDSVTSPNDPGFDSCIEYIAEHIDNAPASIAECELHEFWIRESNAFDSYYIVFVRDNRCVGVVWAGGSMRPV